MLPIVQTEPIHFKCGIHSFNVATSPPAALPPSLTPESDVDELVDIFFDVDVAVNAIPRIESCDLQLGDTWRGMQSKMSVTAPVKKIRKKSDNKPQSQINKCHNEKKRRELENETINQLEELLGTCLAEVKQPDKNGIVREATRKIQEVLRQRRECPDECPLQAAKCLSPVQAGEVSSTQPPCVGLYYTELTSLIEALKHYTNKLGWVLLEINSKAEIVCITENIKELTLQDRIELHQKSIFSILHVKDHVKIRPLLRNTQTVNWGPGEVEKFQAIKIRLVIKNTNGTDSAGYVDCVIHAALVRGSTSEEAGSVMCVIRRYEDASAALVPGDGDPPAITAKQTTHLAFRLDCNYVILFCDLSGVENLINTSIPLVGTRYLELVENSDRVRVAAYLQKAVSPPAPPAVSEPFRLRIDPDRPALKVIAYSRLFRAKPSSGESDFIMSTHTVISDEDMDILETEGPRPTVGGPLMSSVANGESTSCDARYRSPMSPNDGTFLNDFDLDPWTSSLLGDMTSEETKERKENTSDEPSQPATPRAPSTPGEGPPSNQPAEESNRLRLLLSKKPLPGGNEGTTNSNNILKGLLKQEDEEGTSSETSAPHTPHTPAAALSPLHSAQGHARAPLAYAHAPPRHALPHHHHHHSDSLLGILNDKSEEDGEDNRRNSSDNNRGGGSQQSVLSLLLSTSNNGSSGNNRSQDNNENFTPKFGGKRKFEESKGVINNAKRATPENQQVTSSAHSSATSPACSTVASSPASSSSSSMMSDLCQKNQILVALLARQQTPLPTPPPTLRAYSQPSRPRSAAPPHQQHPQHPPPHQQHPPPHPPHAQQTRHHINSTLSNILTGPPNHRANNMNGGLSAASTASNVDPSTMSSTQSHLQQVLQRGPAGIYPSPNTNAASLHYGTTAPHHVYNNQSPSGSSRAQGGRGADVEIPSDKMLSDLLDEFIADMPEADRPAPDVNVQQRQSMKGKTAVINEIWQSLIQCEMVSKPSVSSAGAPPAYSVQSPGSPSAGAAPTPAEEARERWRAPPYAVEPRRAPVPVPVPAPVEHHRVRLLHLQRSQHIMVPPEAAEQPQSDLASDLVSVTAPPNVTLTRTDYHTYHTNQIGGNYGTNKIPTSQQNPMLSRQLSVAGSGAYSHAGNASSLAAAALHTPMTPQPYHRAPRPHLVGGYYEEGAGGYCVDYARAGHHHPHSHPHHAHAPAAAHLDHHHHCTGGGTSEYLRNELRALVGARPARPDLQPLQQPDMDSLISFDMPTPGGGGVVGGRASSTPTNSWESQQSTPNTTEAVSAEAGPAAGGDEARAAAGADADADAETMAGANRASLLQKLLSQ